MNKLGKVAVALAMALVTIESFGARLPVGYREVMWIESTGQQSINLGFTPDKTKTGVVMEFNSGTYANATAFFGTSWGNNCYLFNQQSDKYMFHGSSVSLPAKSPNCDMTLTIVPDGTGIGALTIDNPGGTAWKTAAATVGLACGGNLKIFGMGKGNMTSFRLYRLTVTERTVTSAEKDGGEDVVTQEIVHDFIPCYREADGEIGLYDIMESDQAAAFKADANQTAKFKKGRRVLDSDELYVSAVPEDLGEVVPTYGATNGLAVGESFVCTASACSTNAGETIVYECRGYTVTTNGVESVSGSANSFTYTHPDCAGGAELVWKWEPSQYKLDIGVAGGGTVDVESQFVTSGGVVAVTATPVAGMKFWKWTGTAAAAATRYSTNTTVTVSEAKTLTANFYDPTTVTPTNVYVTVDGAGTMDGSDWDNAMKSITKAYALCADNPAGGTVHLAGGFYRSNKGNFTSGAGVVLAERVTLRGETDPYGDTPVVITGDQSLDDVWNDITGTPKIWVNNAYQPPSTRTRLGKKSTNDSNFMSGTAAADCTFENILFNGFTGYALSISKSPNLTVRKCRFLGFGSTEAHPGTNPATFTNCENLLVDGCEIEGGNFGFWLANSGDTFQTVTVRDSRVAHIYPSGAYSSQRGAIHLEGKQKPYVLGCTIEEISNGNAVPTAIYSLATSTHVISNCVIRSCSTSGGNMLGHVYISKDVRAYFYDTLFANNKQTLASAPAYCASVCVGFYDASGTFVNCSFVSNRVTVTSEKCGYNTASVLSTVSFGDHQFVNCTFDGNCATGGPNAAISMIGGWREQKYGFGNCTFRNNDVLVDGNRSKMINQLYTKGNAPTFVNTIIWHDADDFIPFTKYTAGSEEAKSLGVASSLIKNYTPETAVSNSGYFYAPILDTDPLFAEKAASSELGSKYALSLVADSDRLIRRKGVPICRATDGKHYFLDTHKSPNVWREIAGQNHAKLSLAQGEAVGLVPGMDPIPDAFGEPRKAGAVAMGALNAPSRGMMLLVK